MAARVINVLEAYLKSLRSAAAAPLTCSTNEQARTIFNKLSEIDGLHVGLRQKVQNIQRPKKRKAERLLERTPNHRIIRANLRRIYGSGEAASQTASSLRDAHSMVVWRWIRTIPTRDWDNGAISADVRSLVMARMAETQEASVLTPQEFNVMKEMAEGELRKSEGYLDFYNTMLQFYRQQKSSIPNILNISTQQAPQSSSLQNDTIATTVQGRTSSKRMRLQSAENTGYYGTPREEDTSGEDRFAVEAYASSQQGQTHGLLDDEEREIELVYTNAPVENIPFLGEPIASSIDDSEQRKSEIAIRATHTDCISVLVPKGVKQDMSLTIWIGRELGHKIIAFLELQLKETPRLQPKPSGARRLQNNLITGIVC